MHQRRILAGALALALAVPTPLVAHEIPARVAVLGFVRA